MDLTHLQRTLRQFAAERDWERFHTPKNLAMALMVEAAELAEIFQWLTPEQSQAAHGDRVEQERIGDEVADVLLYLLQLADHCDIDLKRAVGRKLQKNAARHPPVRQGQPVGPLALLADEVHVLIDWENVQPLDADLQRLVPDATHVWLFHNRTQKVAAHHQGFGDRRTLIPITRTGKNALDFHLTFYMGYIISRHPEARIVVLSNDQGYAPMLEHAQDLGFRAELIGMERRVAARKRSATAPAAPAKKAPAAKKAARKTVAARDTVSTAAAEPAASQVAPVKARPAKTAKTATAKKAASPRPAPEQPAASRKTAEEKKPAAKKTRAERVVAPVPAASDRDYAHVLKALRKTADRPSRRARLQAWVRSLLEGGQGSDAVVQAMIDRLVAEGHLAVTGQGAVSYLDGVPTPLAATRLSRPAPAPGRRPRSPRTGSSSA